MRLDDFPYHDGCAAASADKLVIDSCVLVHMMVVAADNPVDMYSLVYLWAIKC